MRKYLALASLGLAVLVPSAAHADTYAAGSLIIPMDTTYQDAGMFKAYGLVYELLRNGIPVQWAIRRGKNYGGVDFTASATPYPSGTAIVGYGYRGGPWLVSAENASAAKPIITAWKAKNTTTVHVASAAFDADIARYLVTAPTIAMVADGNQKIARKYMQAAGIPDSTLDYAWPDTSPDMLTPAEIAGPSKTNHADGKLFDQEGAPVYCQLMSMHWAVSDARATPEVVAEVRSFLGHPTHFYAECQAVNAFENDPVYGHFLTPNGFSIASQPKTVDFYNADYPFAQLDGPFATTGGSEPAYSLPSGDSYKDADIVMVTAHGTPRGVGDVWMTGYLDGACSVQGDVEGTSSQACLGIGKVSYLGGHEWGTSVPISTNPSSQGTRLFLNSLFEAPCATETGQPRLYLGQYAPPTTTNAQVVYTFDYSNDSPTTALSAVLRDPLPAGATFVSASAGGVYANGQVTWDLKNLGKDEFGQVTLTLRFGSHATYGNQAFIDYKVGLNSYTVSSNAATTVYDGDSDSDGIVDSLDSCPSNYNPAQSFSWDVQSCGSCGTLCSVQGGTPRCSDGACIVSDCDASHSDCDRSYATGCEYANAGFQSDVANCGRCGQACTVLNGTAACVSGTCAIAGCSSSHADCNTLAGDGCEYDTAGFSTDRNNCGGCGVKCAATELCQAGKCVMSSCPVGKADCSAPSGDCETSILISAGNCGGCGIACAPPHAAGVCSAGVCAVGTCSPGFSDCNGLAGDGCEYAVAGFAADPDNCGACGVSCQLVNGSGTCIAGACQLSGCRPGFSDCDGVASNGCEYAETGFASDAKHCGGCGTVCSAPNASGVCANGSCSMGACVAGFVDLDHDPANGCEFACTATTTPETTCNGADDDCDGRVDEDYIPSHCGAGACAAASVCNAASEACVPSAPSVEGPIGAPNCSDGADNDCDGNIDDADTDCLDATGSGGTGAGGGSGAGSAGSVGAGGSTVGVAGTGASEAGGAAGAAGATGAGATSATSGGSSASGATGGDVGGKSGGSNSLAGHGGVSSGTSGSSAASGSGQANTDASEQAGCGCSVPGQRSSSPRSAAGLLLVGLVAWRRRRRAAA